MSVAWTLTVEGTEKSLADWGIDSASFTRHSLEPDELVLHVPRRDALTSPDWGYGDDVILKRGSTIWFVGTISQLPTELSEREEGETYTVSGPWWLLERVVYQQRMKVVGTNCAVSFGSYTPKVILGHNDLGRHITVGQEIQKIIDYADAKSVPVAGGLLPTIGAVPYVETTNITCAEAIKEMLKWSPDCVSWFDYSTGTPVLHIQPRDSLANVSISAEGSSDYILGNIRLQPRNDLVPAGVKFLYLQPEYDETAAKNLANLSSDSAGTPDGIGSIVVVVELANSDTVPIAGLAAQYLAALSTVHYQGTLTMLEQEVSGTVRVGNRLNVTDGQAPWATMNALVQSVTEDIVAGETLITVGPPEHLGVQDFIELQHILRRRLAPTSFPATKTCSIPDPDAEQPEDPDSTEGTMDNPAAGEDPNGHTLGLMNITGGGGGGTPEHPFQLMDATSGGVAGIRVRYGQVNSRTPKIGSTPISDEDGPVLTGLAEGTNYIFIRYEIDTSDFSFIGAAIIAIGESDDWPDDTAAYGYINIGDVDVAVDGGDSAVTEIRQSVTHSLGHDMCGNTVHQFWGV